MDNRSKFWRGVMVGVLVTAFACLVTVGTSAGIYMFGRRVIDNQVQVQAEQGNSGRRRAPTVRLAIRLSIWSASTESLRSFRDDY